MLRLIWLLEWNVRIADYLSYYSYEAFTLGPGEKKVEEKLDTRKPAPCRHLPVK